MKFLEKNLESLIWENYAACEHMGLCIEQGFFRHGKSYRQLNLAPYGVADMVFINYSARERRWEAQIIELKRGRIDLSVYHQVKRYQLAFTELLYQCDLIDTAAPPHITTVLVGSVIHNPNEFLPVYMQDETCTAFTYQQGINGVIFQEAGKFSVDAKITASTALKQASEWGVLRIENEARYQQHLSTQLAERGEHAV